MVRESMLLILAVCSTQLAAQTIGNFTSIEPLQQSSDFIIPSTHVFQKIIEYNDELTQGGTFPGACDFTAYVPINGDSENGYLSINAENTVGGVSILDVNYNALTKLWEISQSQAVNFDNVGGTGRNCLGTVTPWNTVLSSEEIVSTEDLNSDGYNDLGWIVEIDPVTKTVIDKRWALGNFNHEGIAIHQNQRTVYQGSDFNPGYIYKFVAENAQDLSAGDLYVYSGLKDGPGNWIQLLNTTAADQNSVLAQSADVGATIFDGVEDVEIGPDGLIYFAVKGENKVYRFLDSDPLTGTTVPLMETFVGNSYYDIEHESGTSSVFWGYGNDNLAFDSEGNLWVLQDGDNNYIWVVENGHSQAIPKVKIFGQAPIDSEPTGITFSPDFRFLFMSVQHPDSSNNVTSQIDAAGNVIYFDKDISLVIALEENLGLGFVSYTETIKTGKVLSYPNPTNGYFRIELERIFLLLEINVLTINNQLLISQKFESTNQIEVDLSAQSPGVYLIEIKSQNEIVDLIKLVKN
jgi:uncharacterized protein